MKSIPEKIATAELIAENERAQLYELVKSDIEWRGYIVILKNSTARKTDFKVGWNGFRLSSDTSIEKLKSTNGDVYNWLVSSLKQLRPHVPTELEVGVRARNIPYLIHFTPIENLVNILRHGIFPRSLIAKVGGGFFCDRLRLDGQLNAISLSIGFPNSTMFYKYRSTLNFKGWVVILLNPSILWTKRVLFMKTNAANAYFRDKEVETFCGLSAFESLFKENSLGPSRQEKNLREFDPTDVQAEVLVYQALKPPLIKGLVFECERDLMSLLETTQHEALNKHACYVEPLLFTSRQFARKNFCTQLLEA